MCTVNLGAEGGIKLLLVLHLTVGRPKDHIIIHFWDEDAMLKSSTFGWPCHPHLE